MVMDGATGEALAVGDGDRGRNEAYAEIGLHSIAVDLDGNGLQKSWRDEQSTMRQ